jgi:hypothetical protein
MEIEAVDLSQEEKTFTKYLTNWMPILDKMGPGEMVDLFVNAKKLIDLEKQLLKIVDVKDLVAKIKELQEKYEYPPNKEINSLAKNPDDKTLKKIQEQIKNDIGLDISSRYIDKALYNIESFKDDKKKLMKYITNIILRGSGHGIVTEIDTEIEKISQFHYAGSAEDEKMIEEICKNSKLKNPQIFYSQFIQKTKISNTLTNITITTDEIYGFEHDFYVLNLDNKTLGFYCTPDGSEIMSKDKLESELSSFVSNWLKFFEMSDDEAEKMSEEDTEDYSKIYFNDIEIHQKHIKTLEEAIKELQYEFNEKEIKNSWNKI